MSKKVVEKKKEDNLKIVSFFGATGGIRTPDLPVRSRTLYPAKLQLRDNTYYTVKSKNIQ